MKARLPKGMGGGAPSNLNQLAIQAQKMQANVEKVTAELEAKEYTATTGGNAVNITMTGAMEVKSLEIDPEVVDPEDVEMLSDLVMSAFNEVIRKITEEKDEKLTSATGGMSMPGIF